MRILRNELYEVENKSGSFRKRKRKIIESTSAGDIRKSDSSKKAR